MKKTEELKRNFKIVQLNSFDAQKNTDKILDLKELVLSHENMYPNIDKWFKNKVIPGLISGKRMALIGYIDNNPAVSAIVKLGKHSKFCHLHIKTDIRDENLGDVFFALMARRVKDVAREIHFTLPESLWVDKHNFFKSFNFKIIKKAQTQYRKFEEELSCSSSFDSVWKAVLEKIPKISKRYSIGGYSLDNGLLLSILPEHAKRIIAGDKRVEIRRKFAEKWKGHHVSIYASRPTCALLGEAKIIKILKAEPDSIWSTYKNEINSSKEEFDKYVEGAEKIYAIELANIKPYLDEVPLTQLSHLTKADLKPPQSYYTLQNNKSWSDAVSIAAMLHSSFRTPKKLSPHEEYKQMSFF